MPLHNLQILFNRLERSFAQAESTFLAAEKSRHELKQDYAELLETVRSAQAEMARYPKAQVTRRLKLIETLLNDLQLRQSGEKRSFDALGFLLGRLRLRLASEILEPRLYGKIREALTEELQLRLLREKYPDSEIVVPAPQKPARPKAKRVRLMLVAARNLHYAIPVTRICRKMQPGPVEQKYLANGFVPFDLPGAKIEPGTANCAIAFHDIRRQPKIVYCDEYFTPVEIPQNLLRQMVIWPNRVDHSRQEFRPQLKFYGRHFFVYGARLSYTVRPGEHPHPAEL